MEARLRDKTQENSGRGEVARLAKMIVIVENGRGRRRRGGPWTGRRGQCGDLAAVVAAAA